MKLLFALLFPIAVAGLRTNTNTGTGALRHGMLRSTPGCEADHTADMTKPMEEVIRENPGVDMNCYFEKAGELYSAVPGHDPGLRFWVHPVLDTPDYTQAWRGAESMKQDPATCPGGWHGERSGPLATFRFDGLEMQTHLDCGYYAYDDLYFYALGWLKGQGRLDGSLLSNATAWEEQAAKECERIRQEIDPKPEETSLMYNELHNGELSRQGACAQKESCTDRPTIREFKLHTYTKCLMGGKRTAAGEMAYGYSRACLLEDNMIGHGVECGPYPA